MLGAILAGLILFLIYQQFVYQKGAVLSAQYKYSYWFSLHRKSNVEFLYFGQAGNKNNSQIVKIFKVKSGVPNQKPTPLPKLLGREYWLINAKSETFDPQTAPYFLTLDIPVSENEPFGPTPYPECRGECNWEIPGEFGLHGVSGDETKLSDDDLGSSGCIRHKDQDIAYLYNLIDPKMEIRYYIEDI